MPVNTVNFFSQDPAQLVALQQQQMRAQQLAQALQQQSMEPIQSPSGGGKVSWTQGLAKVLGAVLAQKEGKQANDLQQQIAQQQAQQVRSQLAALNAGDTPATPPSIKPGVIPPASIALPADQQPPLTNQEINPGTPAMPGRPTAEALAAALANPALSEYAKLKTQEWAPTDEMKNDRYAGITPDQRRSMAIANALKDSIPAGSDVLPTLDQNGNATTTPVSGLADSLARVAGQTTAAKERNTPHIIDNPFSPGRPTVLFPTPPALAGASAPGRSGAASPASAPGAPRNAAALEAQKVGAKAGVDYSQKLAEDAEAAVNGKRTLSEMGNLLQGFTPGSFAPVLSNIGAAAQSLGVSPATVEKWTNMRPGDAQAFQKGTAALATEAAKQVSSRVTQMEFKTFLQNNPNWMMQPDGIKRVMDFMDKGFDSSIDKQAKFAAWSQTASPDRWAIDFPASYTKQRNADIAAGKTNSVPAQFAPYRTLKDVKTQSQGVDLPKITSREQFNKLKSGDMFVDENGMIWHKP